MRTLQIVAAKLLCVLALAVGLLMAFAWCDRSFLARILPSLTEYGWSILGLAIGVVLTITGLLGALPLMRPARQRTISFAGKHGDVTIQLDSIEATLGRVVGKMPEVKKISVTVTPSEDNRRAEVTADVLMYKGAEAAGAREIANRISDYLADTAVNILGVEDITTIRLNVRGIIFDAPKPKPVAASSPTAETKAAKGPVVETTGAALEEAVSKETARAEGEVLAEPTVSSVEFPPLESTTTVEKGSCEGTSVADEGLQPPAASETAPENTSFQALEDTDATGQKETEPTN